MLKFFQAPLPNQVKIDHNGHIVVVFDYEIKGTKKSKEFLLEMIQSKLKMEDVLLKEISKLKASVN